MRKTTKSPGEKIVKDITVFQFCHPLGTAKTSYDTMSLSAEAMPFKQLMVSENRANAQNS